MGIFSKCFWFGHKFSNEGKLKQYCERCGEYIQHECKHINLQAINKYKAEYVFFGGGEVLIDEYICKDCGRKFTKRDDQTWENALK